MIGETPPRLVRAKFEVMAITRRKGFVPMVNPDGSPITNLNGEFDVTLGEAVTVELLAVSHDKMNAADTRSWLAVPKGEITIQVTDARAVEEFVVGGHYYVNIEACDE